MPEEDWRPRRPRRRRWPFFGGNFFGDPDEIFRDMEEMMETEFRELFKRVPKNLTRERTLPDGSKVKSLGPFVYGYSVTMGSDGKPQIREFGNIKPETRRGSPRLDIKEKREPLADVMTTDGEIRVIVELPGVDKKDIKLHGTENKLTISVDAAQRKFYKEVNLPANVDPKEAKSTYKNGVLEVTLQKRKKEKPKGEAINIQ